jgi:hypothetical protein
MVDGLATFSELYYSGMVLGGVWNGNFSSSSKVVMDRFLPYVGTKSLLLQVSMMGVTVASLHLVHLMFMDVEYSGTEIISPDWLQYEDKGSEGWVKKPSLVTSQVRVRCTCPAFYFYCSYYNWLHGDLWGTKPKPYKRLTLTYPERNPAHVSAICKHIWNAGKKLQDMGVIAKGGI